MHCLLVGLLLLDLVDDAREQAPKELFRLLRDLLHKILLPCDQDSFAEVLDQDPHEKLGVDGHPRGLDLILDHFSVPFDLVFDLLPDAVEEGGGDGEVLGGKGQDCRKDEEDPFGEGVHPGEGQGEHIDQHLEAFLNHLHRDEDDGLVEAVEQFVENLYGVVNALTEADGDGRLLLAIEEEFEVELVRDGLLALAIHCYVPVSGQGSQLC